MIAVEQSPPGCPLISRECEAILNTHDDYLAPKHRIEGLLVQVQSGEQRKGPPTSRNAGGGPFVILEKRAELNGY